jgi:hypothetical protein
VAVPSSSSHSTVLCCIEDWRMRPDAAGLEGLGLGSLNRFLRSLLSGEMTGGAGPRATSERLGGRCWCGEKARVAVGTASMGRDAHATNTGWKPVLHKARGTGGGANQRIWARMGGEEREERIQKAEFRRQNDEVRLPRARGPRNDVWGGETVRGFDSRAGCPCYGI